MVRGKEKGVRSGGEMWVKSCPRALPLFPELCPEAGLVGEVSPWAALRSQGHSHQRQTGCRNLESLRWAEIVAGMAQEESRANGRDNENVWCLSEALPRHPSRFTKVSTGKTTMPARWRQTWWPSEFYFPDPRGRRRERIPVSCSLTSTHVPWHMPPSPTTCTHAHTLAWMPTENRPCGIQL